MGHGGHPEDTGISPGADRGRYPGDTVSQDTRGCPQDTVSTGYRGVLGHTVS